jgi:hypothetical protein
MLTSRAFRYKVKQGFPGRRDGSSDPNPKGAAWLGPLNLTQPISFGERMLHLVLQAALHGNLGGFFLKLADDGFEVHH